MIQCPESTAKLFAAKACGAKTPYYAATLVNIKLTVSDLRVVSWKGPPLEGMALKSKSGWQQYNKGQNINVIHTAYEGVVRFELTLDESQAANANAKLNDFSFVSTQSTDLKRKIVLESKSRVVFAFETMSAKWSTGHLGGLEPDRVDLKPNAKDDAGSEWDATKAAKRVSAGHALVSPPVARGRWRAATIASGYYPERRSLNQDWNSQSARVVETAALQVGAERVESLIATPQTPLTAVAVRSFAGKLMDAAQRDGSPFVVVYYIGHMLPSQKGKLTLVMGDIPTDETKAQEAVQAGVGVGVLRLEELHAALSETKTPFFLLVDGCLPDDEVVKYAQMADSFSDNDESAMRRKVNAALDDFEPFDSADEREDVKRGFLLGERHLKQFESELFGVTDVERKAAKDTGSDELLLIGEVNRDLKIINGLNRISSNLSTWQEVDKYSRSQRHLTSANPVILSSSPGTLSNPRVTPIIGDSGSVGPLAYEFYRHLNDSAACDAFALMKLIVENQLDKRNDQTSSPRSQTPDGSITWSFLPSSFKYHK